MNMITNDQVVERLMRMGMGSRVTPYEGLWDMATRQLHAEDRDKHVREKSKYDRWHTLPFPKYGMVYDGSSYRILKFVDAVPGKYRLFKMLDGVPVFHAVN